MLDLPRERSDSKVFFLKNGTPDGITIGLGYAIKSPEFSVTFCVKTKHKKKLRNNFNFGLKV